MRWWSSFGSSICCYRLHAAYRRQCALLLFFGLMRSPCESLIYSLCAHLQPKIWDFLQSWPADSSCTGKVTPMLVVCSVFLDKQNNLCSLPVHKWYIYLHSQRAQVSSLPLHRSPDFLSNVALQPSVAAEQLRCFDLNIATWHWTRGDVKPFRALLKTRLWWIKGSKAELPPAWDWALCPVWNRKQIINNAVSKIHL